MSNSEQFISYNISKNEIINVNSPIINASPNQFYKVELEVNAFKGKKGNLFFAFVFMNENKHELTRKIRYIQNFSGVPTNYEIIAQSPPKCRFLVFILRGNDECKVSPIDLQFTFPNLKLFTPQCVINGCEESYDNMTDYEKFWKKFDNKCYRVLVFPKTKKDFFSIPNYGEQEFQNFNINFYEGKKYSQNGEDGIIEFIFSMIGTTNKFFVEFGVGDSSECNGRNLIEKGWQGLMMDSVFTQNIFIKNEIVTAENVNLIFSKYHVPYEFDLLCIDIDYNDYWVWKSLENFTPRVVVIEYNSTISYNESLSVKYDSTAVWDGSNYFGASLAAMEKLGKKKGYTLVGCDNHGVNAFFIKSSLLNKNYQPKILDILYKPPKFGKIVNGKTIGHGPTNQQFVQV